MRKIIPVLAVVLFTSIFDSSAYAQDFGSGWDYIMFGVADKNLTLGTGFSVGLVHAGSVRVGLGFGGVYYPNRPVGDIRPESPSNYCVCRVDRYKDRSDLMFYVPVGFRVRSDNNVVRYFTVAYMRAVTKSEVPYNGRIVRINNGVLMGFTVASK